MKFKTITILTILLAVVIFCADAFSLPRKNPGGRDPFVNRMTPDAPLQYLFLDGNNISAIFYNSGIFNQDPRTQNTPSFMWPKGSNKFACFTAGLSIGCFIDTSTVPGVQKFVMAQVMASYKGEYTPGYIIAGNPPTAIGPSQDNSFKLYKVKAGDNAGNNPDYENWYKMIPYGAPWVDVNNNGIFDPEIDIPGQANASQTLFMTMTDAFVDQKSPGEGFGGGVYSPLLYAEAHFTAWSYNSPGLEDLQFINWVVINKGNRPWTRTYMGVVVDPDLGTADDDYIGCDTVLNMGYCYNGDNDDGVYGTAPPAFGMDYFKSPIIRGNPNDTLGLTSFVFFTNTGSGPPPCESDPNGEPYPAYLMLTGFKKDSTAYLDPTQSPYKKTKFVYPGDPETNSGWTEAKGSIPNCNKDTTGNPVVPNPKGDRRFIFNSGREDFIYNPGDTQNIVLAQFVARGSSNLNSVTKLKTLSKTAQLIYDNNFNVTPPPPAPDVNITYTPTANGLCNITLNWGSASESYRYWDSIFFEPEDSNIYYFEGYEVYEIDKNLTSYPDFTKPETMNDKITLIDIFDVRNNVGVIIDTFATGVQVGGSDHYAPYPIVPPYKMTTPANFPNHGISRSITLTGTKYGQNYGGQTGFVYGQEYRFAVLAYAYSKSDSIRRGFKVIRNSLSTQTLSVRPVYQTAGTQYTYRNGDTLDVNFPIRDLGLIPIVRNQELLRDATYRVQFNSDTTYNILRKLKNENAFNPVAQNLKYVNFKSTTDDSSRTIDGIFFNLQKIRFTSDGSIGGFVGNFGVIKDLTLRADSIQTRKKGWDYLPSNNPWFEGAKLVINNQDPRWQSKSMSLSYPAKNTYNAVGSRIRPDQLRVVKIVFSNDPNKQQLAYRYVARTNEPDADPSFTPFIINRSGSNNFYIYQDKRTVPFTVWEVDPNDSSAAPRQLNCAFLETNDSIPRGKVDGQWNPTADSTGSNEYLYIFNSTYGDAGWDAFYATTTRNLYITATIDVMYVWAARRLNSSATFTENDEFVIYPYTATRPYVASNVTTTPLFYELNTIAPKFGDLNYAKETNALNSIKIVPNPYYGFSTLDRSLSDKFITFRHLPIKCTIKIYSLNGDLIKTVNKDNSSSTAEWDLQNDERVPVASGIYVALIDAPGIGQKVMKIVVFTSQERINF